MKLGFLIADCPCWHETHLCPKCERGRKAWQSLGTAVEWRFKHKYHYRGPEYIGVVKEHDIHTGFVRIDGIAHKLPGVFMSAYECACAVEGHRQLAGLPNLNEIPESDIVTPEFDWLEFMRASWPVAIIERVA